MAATVGIIDYSGVTHCLDHASTVGSYEREIVSTDPAQECWCGKKVGGRKKPVKGTAWHKMNDGVKGQRAIAGSFQPRKRSTCS